MLYLMTFVLMCFLSQPVWAQSPAATLGPTGTLRAVFLGGIPVQRRVDHPGVKVAAVKGQTQELFVSSHLKNAQVRVFQTMRPQGEVERLLTSGEVDAFAINRQRSLDAQSQSNSKLRALSDSFLEVDQ